MKWHGIFVPSVEDPLFTIGSKFACYFTLHKYIKLFSTLLFFKNVQLGQSVLSCSTTATPNETQGISIQLSLDCLFRLTLKVTPKHHTTGLCEGNPPVTNGFPHKGPVMRKTLPCLGAIMERILVGMYRHVQQMRVRFYYIIHNIIPWRCASSRRKSIQGFSEDCEENNFCWFYFHVAVTPLSVYQCMRIIWVTKRMGFQYD